MYIAARTLDDLLMDVYQKLLKSKIHIRPTRNPATELPGVLLQIANPRARLSRTEKRGKFFSCLGEFLWYLARTNDLGFISYYVPRYSEFSDDGRTIYGGYGPRLFDMHGINQVENVIKILRKKPDSRQAVIQLFDASDIVDDHKDIPCTCTLQFMIRNGRLNMFTNMRSNDAYLGLPHDIFAFTMFQEIMARSLNVELGEYKHAVGSLHLYLENRNDAEQYLNEGWQEDMPMPSMPPGDPWPSIELLLIAESELRAGNETVDHTLQLDPYWADFVRLLQCHRFLKDGAPMKAVRVKKDMSSGIYEAYIRKRLATKKDQDVVQKQLDLPGTE